MRNLILLALMAGVLAGCAAMTEAEYVTVMNSDPRVWPPVVAGQAFPVQMMNDPECSPSGVQQGRNGSRTRIPGKGGTLMRNIVLLALVAGFLTGCATMTEAEYVAQMNADPRVWPPVVEGQAFPVQMMNDRN